MANKKYGKKSIMEHRDATGTEVAVAKVEKRMRGRSYFPYINVLLQVFYIIVLLAIILVSYIYLEVPIVPLCTVAVLESVLGALLCRIAAMRFWWIQVIIIGVQILFGYLFDRLWLMVLMALVYAFTLVIMWVRRRTLK